MPTKTRTRIDPDAVYACRESFGGNGFAVAFGEQLPGSHEYVQRYPDMFQPDGEILERPSDLREAIPHEARHYAEHVAAHQPVPIGAADVVQAVREISLSEASPEDVKRLGLTDVTIPKGARFHRWSPLVQLPQYQDLFRSAE